MNKKYLLYFGILLIGITAMLIKNGKTSAEKKIRSDSEVKQQCKAFTSSGKRCRRKALKGKEFCWQHQD
jgi:hypothetical protein